MKITFICEYFPYLDKNISGGAENRCYNIAKNLAKSHEVTVITSHKENQARKYLLDNIRVLQVGPHHKYSNSGANFTRFKFLRAAEKVASKIPSDVISGESFVAGIPAASAAASQKAKSYYTCHETWLGKWIKLKGLITGIGGSINERITLSQDWDKIISVSNTTKNDLIKNNISKNKITTIYNGINLEEFKQLKKYKTPTICCISRLTITKRIHDLVLAVKHLKEDIPNIRCIIIGKGEELPKLKNYIKRLKLEDHIELKGYTEEKELKEILSKSHVFAFPSILEGFGIVLLEALASNTPYVCSDLPVFNEITENYKAGLSFKKTNAKDLSTNILKLLKDKKLYSKKQKEAKKLIKKYDWGEISKQYENLISN